MGSPDPQSLKQSLLHAQRAGRAPLLYDTRVDPAGSFGEFDANKDGYLDVAEFAAYRLFDQQQKNHFQAITITDEGVANASAVYEQYDEDANGRLSEPEFAAGKYRVSVRQ